MSELEALEWEKNTIYHDGLTDGIEEREKNIIKSMLKNNISIELISKITEKDIREIEKIKNNL